MFIHMHSPCQLRKDQMYRHFLTTRCSWLLGALLKFQNKTKSKSKFEALQVMSCDFVIAVTTSACLSLNQKWDRYANKD